MLIPVSLDSWRMLACLLQPVQTPSTTRSDNPLPGTETISTSRNDYRHDSKGLSARLEGEKQKNQECHHDSLGFHFLTNLLSTIHYSF